MKRNNETVLNSVVIIGSLPPLRALSSYCQAFSLALSSIIKIEFISFKYIYPSFLYPGGNLKEDNSFPVFNSSGLTKRCNLTWYNPLSWIWEGISSKGQLLHAQWWSPPLFPVYFVICLIYKMRRKPLLITVHNVINHDSNILYDFCCRVLFKLCDHFIVHSEANKKQLKQLYGIEDACVTKIPHGPLEFKNENNLNRKGAKTLIGVNPNDRVILIFGAIRPYKGVDIALKAFAQIVNEMSDVKLVIAGKLWESWDRYERIIKEEGLSGSVVTRLDYIDADEVAGYFLASDLVILPYLKFDSQSGVGAAALAFKKPMIVTKTGGLPELVTDCKNIVEPGDIEALADRIIYCFNDPETMKHMSEDAVKKAETVSWDKVARATVNLYEKILNRKK